MGERHSGDGLPGRRHAHPGGLVAGPVPTGADAEFEAGFAAVLRPGAVDPEAEERAMAAFRTARDSGAHRTRTRRRDDWRPRQERRARLSLRTTLSVLLASLTLGGVAFAAIGSAGPEGHVGGGDRRPAHPSASAPGQPAAEPAATASVVPPVARGNGPGADKTHKTPKAHKTHEAHTGSTGGSNGDTATGRSKGSSAAHSAHSGNAGNKAAGSEKAGGKK
ncbi:hypothetical protein, partial [Streptomyces sp. NRRL F-2799]|uniref:hypothetical protein n=1 Tax=Streptomyces sp. NRRL F-2799 TaxID=1463844 RepID=UPI0004CB6819